MIISILFASSILAVAILSWLFRQRLALCLRKETMRTAGLFAAVALFLLVVLLPDICLRVHPRLCHTLSESCLLLPPQLRSASAVGIPACRARPRRSSIGKAKTVATKTRPLCRPRPLHNDPKETRCETSFRRPSF